MSEKPKPKITTRKVPVLDTGLGREAGYANDAALIAAGEKRRAELREMLTDEAWKRLEQAEEEAMNRFLFGSGAARKRRGA